MSWALRVLENFGYLGIASIVALENLFPPLPSEIILPFAGFLTGRGTLSVLGVIIASTIGSLLGSFLLYGAGRMLGRERLYRLARRHSLLLNETGLKKASHWFAKYGPWTVFICRMVPTLRSLISIPAGLIRMTPATFFLYTLAGTIIWNTTLICLGAALGTAWPRVVIWLRCYGRICLAILAMAMLAGLAWLIPRRRARRSKAG